MKTELQEITDRLSGYSDEPFFEVINAAKDNEGRWHIVLTTPENEKELKEKHDRFSKACKAIGTTTENEEGKK